MGKKLNPLEDPPTASSSDEDELDAMSGEEEAEEQISDDSPSEEDDDLVSPVIVPPATKPKTQVRHAVASGSELSPSKPIAVTGSKRPSEKISSKKVHTKRPKKVSGESEKKPLFQRLWTEEDEISLLQGMIDFKFETGKTPYEDLDGFYVFIKKSISFDASKNQALDKIRALKKKYMGNLRRGVESLPKAHDMECLELSKSIWGSHGMAHVKKSDGMAVESDVTVKKKSEKRKVDSLEANEYNVEEDREVLANGDKEEEEEREVLVNGGKVEEDKEVLVNGGDSKSVGGMRTSDDWFEDSFLVGYIAGLGVGEGFVKQKWSMVAVETKKRMEEKWKLLQAKEMELVLKKTDFMREVGSVIAEAS